MQGSATPLLKFMTGSDKRFLIPVYQRNYDWKIANCSRLYDDLVRATNPSCKNHFFGSIVAYYDSETVLQQDYLIIDGQQRLTTVSLLLLAMYNALQNGAVIAKNSSLANKIYGDYLVDVYASDDTKIKLKPVKNDRKAFDRLFGDEDGYYRNSNLTINYEFFYNQIIRGQVSVDDLFVAVSKLVVICIMLNHDDNPQLIFESLNSTGLDLTEGDKIRNFVLMGQPTSVQDKYYENYWNPIEELTGYDPSTFVRDWISMKMNSIPSINNVYEVFKKYSLDNEIAIEDLLKELYQYARYHEILIKGSSSFDAMNAKLTAELRASIRRLNWLEATVTRPFFLELMHLYYSGVLDGTDMKRTLDVIEDYLFRRFICEVATNALNKIFVNLNRDIKRLDGTRNQYVDKLIYVLSSKKESGRYPDDEEFLTALSERNIYNMRGKYRTYILERYENYGTKEVKDVYKGLAEGTYSIEHIMPQNLTPTWMEALGNEYERIHSTWLHRLANLTLTAYNSNYSNEPFETKKNLVDKTNGQGIGFCNSGLRMNQWIAKKNEWTEKELLERNEYMLEQAKIIWPFVTTDYAPAEKELESVSLDDEVSLTGRQISRFSFRGSEQPVSSWTEAYTLVLKMLYQEDESILRDLAYSTDPSKEMAVHIMTSKLDNHTTSEIADGIYVWTGISTDYKLNNLRKFFKLYNEDPSDLTFYLKEMTAPITNDDEFANMKRAYWTYALPIIKEANNHECFEKDNPGAYEFMSGYIGIAGAHLSCSISQAKIRVNFYFESSHQDWNKKMFDGIYARKSEIEAQLGSLEWSGADNKKTARIGVTLNDVSYLKKEDWEKMADFMAVWSNKIRLVIKPYVEQISKEMSGE